MKEKWISVIRDSRNEPSYQPTSRSVVCSTHFKSDDLYYTAKGLRRVKQNAYPKVLNFLFGFTPILTVTLYGLS